MAADGVVGMNATTGVGVVTTDEGRGAGVEACRLHLQDGGEGAPEVAGFAGQGVAVAALYCACWCQQSLVFAEREVWGRQLRRTKKGGREVAGSRA